MATFKNYYQVLGLETFAEAEEIKAAFRKLARQHHPDLNANNRQAEEKFKELNEAYDVLSNPDKKAMHDVALQAKLGISGKAAAKTQAAKAKAYTESPPSGGAKAKGEQAAGSKTDGAKTSAKEGAKSGDKAGKGGGIPINELFESFMKKGSGDGASGRSEPEEGIFRSQREAQGNDKGDKKEKHQRGEDVVVKTAITPPEAQEGVVKTVNVQHNELCRRCSGTGKVNGAVCTACNGEKINIRLKKIDVRIPAGVKNGSRVRVAREGGRGRGGAESGDLFLQIEISYDPTLRIEGLDVHGEAVVSVTDAVLGAEIDVQTLNGPVKMTVPPGTQNGKVLRLKERGVQSGAAKGDHFVTVVVQIPENLSARERELYQELARLRPEKPNQKKPR
jgi:DnaJ-class molecular chaperone